MELSDDELVAICAAVESAAGEGAFDPRSPLTCKLADEAIRRGITLKWAYGEVGDAPLDPERWFTMMQDR